MSSEYETLMPVEHYKSFVSNNKRPDGRNLDQFRKTVMSAGTIGTADGSAVIKIGSTKVVCGIKAELARPSAEKPDEGYLIPNVVLPPLCSPRIKSGPPGETAQAASQFIADLVSSSSVLKLTSLVLKSGQWVWALHADLICLDLDGSLLDACVIALVSALQNLTLPEVQIDEDSGDIAVGETRQKLENELNPVASTFAMFEGGAIISDPTSKEEQLALGTTTITVDRKNIVNIYKPGGYGLSDADLQSLIKKATKRGKEVSHLLKEVAVSSVDR